MAEEQRPRKRARLSEVRIPTRNPSEQRLHCGLAKPIMSFLDLEAEVEEEEGDVEDEEDLEGWKPYVKLNDCKLQSD